MKKIFTVSDLQKVVSMELPPPPCDDTLQVTVQYAKNGEARGVWLIDKKYMNGLGVAMGGFVSAAADILMAYAISSLLDEEKTFASIDLDTTFHRPAIEGQVEIIAKVERLGKSVAYVTAQLTQRGKRVASCVSSLLIQD